MKLALSKRPCGLDLLTSQLFVSEADTIHHLWLVQTLAIFYGTVWVCLPGSSVASVLWDLRTVAGLPAWALYPYRALPPRSSCWLICVRSCMLRLRSFSVMAPWPCHTHTNTQWHHRLCSTEEQIQKKTQNAWLSEVSIPTAIKELDGSTVMECSLCVQLHWWAFSGRLFHPSTRQCGMTRLCFNRSSNKTLMASDFIRRALEMIW